MGKIIHKRQLAQDYLVLTPDSYSYQSFDDGILAPEPFPDTLVIHITNTNLLVPFIIKLDMDEINKNKGVKWKYIAYTFSGSGHSLVRYIWNTHEEDHHNARDFLKTNSITKQYLLVNIGLDIHGITNNSIEPYYAGQFDVNPVKDNIATKPQTFNSKKIIKITNKENGHFLTLLPATKTQYRNEYTITEHPSHTEYRNKYITTTTTFVDNPDCDYDDARFGICQATIKQTQNHDNYTKWYATQAQANAEHTGTSESRNVEDGVQTHTHHTHWFDSQADADAEHAGTSQTRDVASTTPSGTQGADK